MTLFATSVEGEPVFMHLLDKYYKGVCDERTVALLSP